MKISCANCGATIHLVRDEAFLACPYCNSTLYLDRAHTFKHFLLKPAVSKARAKSILESEFTRRELPDFPLLKMEAVLLPFWGLRGKESAETIPAFSPRPQALNGYGLPSAGAEIFQEPPPDYRVVGCSEASSAHWEERDDRASFSLFHVPFIELTYGSPDAPFSAWLDAVSGKLYFDQSPPALTERISRRFWAALSLLFLAFFLESLLFPGWLAFPAVALTAGGSFPFLCRFLEGGRP